MYWISLKYKQHRSVLACYVDQVQMFILKVILDIVLFPYTGRLGSAGQSVSETCLNKEPGFNTIGVYTWTMRVKGKP